MKKLLLLAFFISLGLSQAYAICIKIDCSAAISQAVQEVDNFTTEATNKSKQSLEEFKKEIKTLEKLREERKVLLRDKETEFEHYGAEVKQLKLVLEKHNSLKTELLSLKVAKKPIKTVVKKGDLP